MVMDPSKFREGTGGTAKNKGPTYRYYTTGLGENVAWHIVSEDDGEDVYACCGHKHGVEEPPIRNWSRSYGPALRDVCASCLLSIIIGYDEPELEVVT